MLISLAILGLLIEVMFLLMLGLADLQKHVLETIVLQVGTSVFYLISGYLILKIPQFSARLRLRVFILAAALVFRLTAWPLFPAFSDDVFRYRWEGKLQAQGGNPYQVMPIDPRWAGIRDSTFSRVVVPDFKAGYGPLTELLELVTYAGVSRAVAEPFGQVFWFKLPSVLFDLGIIAAVYRHLKLLGLPPERVLIYAWCPLPIFEFWANGHNDSIAVFFVVAALACAAASRRSWALCLLGLATAAKIWPAVLFPLFIDSWRPGRLMRSAAVFAGTAILFAWPYFGDVRENVQFTSGFFGGWRNNDLLFGLLLNVTKSIYGSKYLAFAILGAIVIGVSLARLQLEKGVLIVITCMLAISANVHPWYLSWFLPLLAVFPLSPLFLWTALMPLTYAVLIEWFTFGVWNGSTAIRWYVYAPVLGYWALRTVLKASIPNGGLQSHTRKDRRS